MSRPWRLPTDEVGRLATHLRDSRWDWKVESLDAMLDGIAWHVVDRKPDRPLLRLASLERPALRAQAMALEPDDEVVKMLLRICEPADELELDGQAQLDGIAERLAADLPELLGAPDGYDGPWPVWSGLDCDVSLRRSRAGVAIAAEHRVNLARSRGDVLPPGPVPRPAPRRASESNAWAAVASGLGRLLVSLTDPEQVSFAVGEPAVLTVNRIGQDVWVTATGPEDEVEPLPLSERQLTALRKASFEPPRGDQAESPPQRSNWWLRLRLPADPVVHKAAGNALVSALRDVYNAQQPSDVVWFGMAMSAGARRVLDSLDITRSEFQR